MTVPPFSSLDGLADLGSRSGIDVRPTLLRVLTDLYVQKLAHTPDEDRQYTELALRLMEAVDVATRATVAARLASHPAPPASVLARLQRSLPKNWRQDEHAANESLYSAGVIFAAVQPPCNGVETGAYTAQPADAQSSSPDELTASMAAASELNELFLSANADERRLILLNLDVAGPPAKTQRISRDPHACQRLETAALAHNSIEFVQHLARSLRIAPGQALRIVQDELGEPIVVAARILNMPAEMLQRILLFLNPTVGRSVVRVHALATLFHEITLPAAEHMLALWQALGPPERTPSAHRPILWNDQTSSRPRAVSVPNRTAAVAREPAERRSGS